MEINKSSKASFSYEGTVVLQVMNGKQVITCKKYHNRGLSAFFKNLCMLLTNQEDLASVVPNAIALYNFSDESLVAANPPSKSWEQLTTRATESETDFTSLVPLIRVSPYLPINTSFVRENTDTTTKVTTYTAVLQFAIPYSLISGDKVYALALFPRAIDKQNPEQSALAFYPITDAVNSLTGSNWLPLSIQKATNNAKYNLIVEWQMDFENV